MVTTNYGETTNTQGWFDDYAVEEDDFQIDEYDLTASPNDFNVSTIFNIMESGAIRIPGFQRNYVWDIARASKLIESLILGLPVPQVFLYEESRNRFLVIDGQQRLMSIYYFIKRRFPVKEKRADLRSIFDRHGHIPDEYLHNDEYFTNFKLSLPEKLPNKASKFRGLNYSTLGDYKLQFDLRPIRNVIIKQNSPSNDDSSIYEIFNRLNTGGVNLRPQEIRASMYHSEFYDMLYKVNTLHEWRRILQMPEPDIHNKDIEILLRGFAMLINGDNYTPSLTRFLNQFSKRSKANDTSQNSYLEQLFESFLAAIRELPNDIFINKRNRRFNLALFEAVFAASCLPAFQARTTNIDMLNTDKIQALDNDQAFLDAALKATTQTTNVRTRLQRAREIINAQ